MKLYKLKDNTHLLTWTWDKPFAFEYLLRLRRQGKIHLTRKKIDWQQGGSTYMISEKEIERFNKEYERNDKQKKGIKNYWLLKKK